jgi:hypothetical protein
VLRHDHQTSAGGTVHDTESPFDDVHRAQGRRIAAIVGGWAVAAGIVVAGMAAVGSASAQPVSKDATIPFDGVAAVTAVSSAPVPVAPPPATVPVPAPPVVAGPVVRTITIAATGYQAELDACQWVRMDLLDTVPMVGAHTSCGGSMVLALHDGDVVRLVGQGLDGTYRTLDSRDAHSGDDAATATDGMDAAIILQTCYPGTSGRVRLVGLVPA